MVSWQTVVSISFEIAERKGAQFQNIDDGGDFLTQVAAYWSQNKDELKQLTEQQARNRLQRVIDA